MLANCCFCGALATGRICFLNLKDEVVDNPCCEEHFPEVYQQTKRSLIATFNHGNIGRDFMLRQSWTRDQEPPSLPANKQELLSRGAVYVQ